MTTNRTTRIPTYSRDPRSGRGFTRYTDPKTKKRTRQWFPGEFGSPESRGAFREFVLQFTGRIEAATARMVRERRTRDGCGVRLFVRSWVSGRVSRSPTRAPGREQDAEVNAVDDFVVVEVRGTIIDLTLTPEDDERAEVAAVRDAVLVEVGRAWIGRKITVVT